MRWALAAVVVAGAFLAVHAAPAPVYAQSGDAEVEELIEKASGHYDMLEIPKAEAKLKQAIRTGRSTGASDAVMARAFVMFGIVRFGGTRDKKAAEKAFIKAIETHPDAKIPDVYMTPALKEIWKSASQKAQPPERSKGVDTFTHEPIQRAQAGEPLEVTAKVPADMDVATVFVSMRRYNQESWHRVDMAAVDGEPSTYRVSIEGRRIYTSQINYYVAAVDPTGNVVARSGRRSSPHTITVLGSSDYTPPGGGDDTGDGDTGDTGDGDTGDDDTGDDDDDGSTPSKQEKKGYVDLRLGTGGGILPGGTPTANPERDVKPGLAPAFAHLQLEGGYSFSRNAHLGLYFRWQFSPVQDLDNVRSQHEERFVETGNDAYKTDRLKGFTGDECFGIMPGDCLLGLKYKWYFTDSYGFRAFSSVGGGVGRIRHWLRLKERADDPFCNGKETIDPANEAAFCYRRDTVRPGWMHFGVGGGFSWDFNETFSLLGEAYLEVFFPDTAVNLDVTLGPQVRF